MNILSLLQDCTSASMPDQRMHLAIRASRKTMKPCEFLETGHLLLNCCIITLASLHDTQATAPTAKTVAAWLDCCQNFLSAVCDFRETGMYAHLSEHMPAMETRHH